MDHPAPEAVDIGLETAATLASAIQGPASHHVDTDVDAKAPSLISALSDIGIWWPYPGLDRARRARRTRDNLACMSAGETNDYSAHLCHVGRANIFKGLTGFCRFNLANSNGFG